MVHTDALFTVDGQVWGCGVTDPCAAASRREEHTMNGFKQFLLRGNLVDLAVGFVVGAAFAALVTGLVTDFITPLIAAIGGKPSFGDLYFTVNGAKFMYGHFLNLLISFVIIAAVTYFLVVVPFSRLMERFQPTAEEPAPTTTCTHCHSSIPEEASVCAFCTRDVKPVGPSGSSGSSGSHVARAV